MRKILGFLFVMVFAISCENDEPQVLNEVALKSALDKSNAYRELVKVLSTNYIAVSSMNENEKNEFSDLAAKAEDWDYDAIVKFGKMCEKFNFSSRNIKLYKSLMGELNRNYTFNKADFDKILKADYGISIENLLANGRVLVAAPFPFCIFYCEEMTMSTEEQLREENPWSPENSENSQEEYENALQLVVSGIYYGCITCCNSSNCRPE
jgi:hypothetical protein